MRVMMVVSLGFLLSCMCYGVVPTDGMVMHLDAGTLGLSDGDPVGTWADQSGAGNDAEQPTSANRPVYRVSIPEFGGQPGVEFDGVDDWMSLEDTMIDVGATTIFVVGNFGDVSEYFVGTNAAAGARFRIARYGWGDGVLFYRVGAGGGSNDYHTGDDDSIVRIYAMRTSPDNGAFLMDAYRDGERLGGASFANAGSPSAFTLGAYNAGETDFLSGNIAEVILYNRTLSETELNQVGNHLEMKYALDTQYAPKAINVSPADGAVDVPVETDLEWMAGDSPDLTGHFVYLGITPDELQLETSTALPADTTTYSPDLAKDLTYYWRIDESINNSDPNDPNTVAGDVWQFATELSLPEITSPAPGELVIQYEGAGKTAVLTVSAVNPLIGDTSGLSYQWYDEAGPLSDAGDFSGTQTAALQIANFAEAYEDEYYCNVANTNGDMNSGVIDLRLKKRIAYYPFDGNADDVEGDNDGTPGSAVVFDTLDPMIGSGALQLSDDPNARVELPTSAVPNADSGLRNGSIIVWVKSSVQQTMTIMGVFNTGLNTAFRLDYQVDGETEFFLRADGGDTLIMNCNLNTDGRNAFDGNWHQLVYTWNTETSSLAVYFDGVVVPAAYKDDIAPDQPLSDWEFAPYIGATNSRGSVLTPFNGSLDDLQILNYPLSALEVATLYTDITGGWVCLDQPTMDLDDNCRVDLADFALIAEAWLNCGRVPATACDE